MGFISAFTRWYYCHQQLFQARRSCWRHEKELCGFGRPRSRILDHTCRLHRLSSALAKFGVWHCCHPCGCLILVFVCYLSSIVKSLSFWPCLWTTRIYSEWHGYSPTLLHLVIQMSYWLADSTSAMSISVAAPWCCCYRLLQWTSYLDQIWEQFWFLNCGCNCDLLSSFYHFLGLRPIGCASLASFVLQAFSDSVHQCSLRKLYCTYWDLHFLMLLLSFFADLGYQD